MGTVAFTGYRPNKMPFKEDKYNKQYIRFRELQFKVISRLTERGYTHFISGVAIGFDTWAAEDVLELQSKEKISLECAIPCPYQEQKWSFADKKRYTKILREASKTTLVCRIHSDDCYFLRNKYMVDNADVIVCAYDGRPGGTAHTVSYALNQNKIVIQINPTTLQVKIISKRTFHDEEDILTKGNNDAKT